jgi:hypothetical protein
MGQLSESGAAHIKIVIVIIIFITIIMIMVIIIIIIIIIITTIIIIIIVITSFISVIITIAIIYISRIFCHALDLERNGAPVGMGAPRWSRPACGSDIAVVRLDHGVFVWVPHAYPRHGVSATPCSGTGARALKPCCLPMLIQSLSSS